MKKNIFLLCILITLITWATLTPSIWKSSSLHKTKVHLIVTEAKNKKTAAEPNVLDEGIIDIAEPDEEDICIDTILLDETHYFRQLPKNVKQMALDILFMKSEFEKAKHLMIANNTLFNYVQTLTPNKKEQVKKYKHLKFCLKRYLDMAHCD